MNNMSATERVIVLIDMDCFYCQVEQKLNPLLYGKPVAVVQYNAWKGGGLIAVNYEARARGVTRHMRGNDARKICPEIELATVPTVREKADLTRYREAGKRVAEVLQDYTSLLERASIDEAYLDITEPVLKRLDSFQLIKPEELKNSHFVGFDTPADYLKEISCDEYLHESNIKLAIGGVITEEIRAAVYERTGYRCSAGIAHNKILAKLTCGLHKPNQQTVLPHESVAKLYNNLSVKKIQSMGGKFGDEVINKLNISTMKDLIKFSEKELQQLFEHKTANWLYNLARGINLEPVTVRLISKSIGCCKRFAGRAALVTEESVKHWMKELSTEIAERIEKDITENNRKPKQLIVNYGQKYGRKEVTNSRSQGLNTIEQEKIFQDSYEIIRKNCQKNDGTYCISFLGINVSKFEENKNIADITSFFKNAPKSTNVKQELSALSKEIESIVQANIELDNSFKEKLPKKSILDNFLNNTSISKSSENLAISEKLEINDSDDSIAELEAINASASSVINNADVALSEKIQNSFFNKFLQTVKPPNRDFNTSAIFEEGNSQVEENQETDDSIEDSNRSESPVIISKSFKTNVKPNVITMFQINSIESPSTSKTIIDGKELCTECSKLIPLEEIASHMDYHFALKIVKDEAHLYKPSKIKSNEELNTVVDKKTKSNNNKTNKNASASSTGRKRKSSQLNNPQKAAITNYFNKTSENEIDDDYELCSECCKRIKLEEMPSHIDYHVAKKLHHEINAGNVLTLQNQNGNNNNYKASKSVLRKCDKNVNSDGKSTIAQYFTKL